MRSPQEVSITWMPFPENKPYADLRPRLVDIEKRFDTRLRRKWYRVVTIGKWIGDDLFVNEEIVDKKRIFAYAYLPDGYKE